MHQTDDDYPTQQLVYPRERNSRTWLIAGGVLPLFGPAADLPVAAPTVPVPTVPVPTAAVSGSPEGAATSPAFTSPAVPTPRASASPPPLPPPAVPSDPVASGPAVVPSPLALTTEARVDCVRGRHLLAVGATASEQLERAVLTIWDGSAPPDRHPMAVDGASASVRVGPVSGPLAWSVTVTAVDGRTAETEPAGQRLEPCPSPGT